MKERTISRRQVLKLAGAAGAVGMVGVPGVAVAAEDSDEKRLFIGFSLHPTGPTSTAGTFVMSGRFEDSGSSTADHITLVPIDNTDRSRLSGNQQFVGLKGTIFTQFKGISFPNMSPHGVGEGRFTILSGTGAYAGIRGRGSFLIVVDFISNQFIGTETGNVEG
jgi:TAT (twin-arginine translocation) pathway-exported protein